MIGSFSFQTNVVYLCIFVFVFCVFVYLCICVFVYLCICVFVYLWCIPLNFYSTYCFSVNVSTIFLHRNLDGSLSWQVYLQVNFNLLLDRLDTFSSPYLLVFKLESVPRCSGIFHSVMRNSFIGLYFHFIPSSSVLSTTSQQFAILIMTI